MTGIPLAYVMRENPEVFPEGADPVENYTLMQDELITHVLILTVANPNASTATYLTDHEHVWDKITAITHELDCWTYVHPPHHARDGSMAYLNLNGHYLGVNNVDNMSTLAEAKLASTLYDGEKHHWNFEKYVKVHVNQHVILVGLVEHGYSGIDERSKVHHLMQGIKILETWTQSRNKFCQMLHCTMTLMCGLTCQGLHHTEPLPVHDPRLQIAKVGTKKEDEDHSENDTSIEDHYHMQVEYSKLTSIQGYSHKLMGTWPSCFYQCHQNWGQTLSH